MIMMGDMNATAGKDTEVWGEILGKHEEIACSENWGWLPQSSFQRMVPVQENTPVTWECRGRGLKSITDYLPVRKEYTKDVKDVKDAKDVKDVKVVRGADLF